MKTSSNYKRGRAELTGWLGFTVASAAFFAIRMWNSSAWPAWASLGGCLVVVVLWVFTYRRHYGARLALAFGSAIVAFLVTILPFAGLTNWRQLGFAMVVIAGGLALFAWRLVMGRNIDIYLRVRPLPPGSEIPRRPTDGPTRVIDESRLNLKRADVVEALNELIVFLDRHALNQWSGSFRDIIAALEVSDDERAIELNERIPRVNMGSFGDFFVEGVGTESNEDAQRRFDALAGRVNNAMANLRIYRQYAMDRPLTGEPR